MPTREAETNLRRFSAGAISGTYPFLFFTKNVLAYDLIGVVSVLFTYPLEIIRVRMAFQTRLADDTLSTRLHPSFIRAISTIYHEGVTPLTSVTSSSPASSSIIAANTHLFTRMPLLKFYRGFSVTIAGMIPYAGTSFLAWGFLRARFLPTSRTAHPTPIADLSIGAVSGALGQTISYPFEVVRRQMQVGGLTRPDRWLRWGEIAKGIWAARGWRGFFVGLSIGYLKIVPMNAVSFAVWQSGKRILGV